MPCRVQVETHLSAPSRWISSMMSSATLVTYARLAQARLMPSHFSGVAMITSAPSSEAMSGVKSPGQAQMHSFNTRLMPSHFSGVAMITSAPSSEAMSGVKSPDQAHGCTSNRLSHNFRAEP